MYNFFKKCLIIYNMYREQVLYLVFGGLTTLISISVYALLSEVLSINVLVANFVSWLAAVTFAYVTNRRFVFCSDVTDASQKAKELFLFYVGRIATLLMEEIILLVFIDVLHFENMPVKILASVVVVAANYIISKLLVFSKK